MASQSKSVQVVVHIKIGARDKLQTYRVLSNRLRNMSSPKLRWYHKWSWFEPEQTRAEKMLLVKQDLMILVFGCLTFFTKVSIPFSTQYIV